ncbi:MAG TPA: alpha/beta hydrolase-fold protein [Pseudomonadales bacterium]|nr:alpha/beta hydrolase-fold protein [Pseudomonadales bacterium]
MVLKRPAWPAGQVVVLEHTSKVLADNPLGDPHTRLLHVWLPPQYLAGATQRRFPVLFDLAGYLGSGPGHLAWRGFEENLAERAARLVHERRMKPAILVFPDCFTALGGNQYINSSAIGHYADYLTRELVPFVDREFRSIASRDGRGCFGKSSGGYGAMVHAMKYPHCWGAVANHSGDAYFEFLYRSDWPNTLDELARFRQPALEPGAWSPPPAHATLAPGTDDGRVRRFLEHVWQKQRLESRESMCLMNLAMAASYDPDPQAPNGFHVPFDLETGALLPQRWKRWLAHDPVRMVARYSANLKTLRGLFIDCGWRDQFHIHYGCRQLASALERHGVDHVYEEFDGTHSGIDHRLERSLPFLSRALG